MEEDDEFGDLYTDVLRPFQSSTAPQPLPVQPKQPSPNSPIDPNVQSDDEEILSGASNSNIKFNSAASYQSQIIAFKYEKASPEEPAVAESSDSRLNLNLRGKREDQAVEKKEGLDAGVNDSAYDFSGRRVSRVLESGGGVELQGTGFENRSLMDESGIDVVVEEMNDRDDMLVEKDKVSMEKKENFDKFDVEEVDTGIGDMDPEPLIPGVSADNQGGTKFATRDEASEDWDSDSEDDLQIVLNGPVAMDNAGAMGSEDEDEDGDPLVIVADSGPGHQPLEEQEWGDDAAQAVDGDKKESGDAAKMNGGVAVAPKIGYSNHTYHPYHSQFKYVRPGAVPMPGPISPAGAPGQVCPPVNVVPVAGRGRGDWRPTGIKNASSMQKSFHPGFGMPGWGNSTSGRSFGGGLEFTLPSHKTIFEVDVDSFEEKPWSLPSIDISDYFNFGLNEESWKNYCKQLEQLRLEATMQSKIRVYESGRTEQEFDPDLPPELAAAVGIRDISSEHANLGKMDAGQSDVTKASALVRPPLPTGRPIQVETGNGERLPSIDTRPPRIRDSDTVIEIVLQDSADVVSFPGNDAKEQLENDPSKEDLGQSQKIERDIAEENTEHFDDFPHAYTGRKRELVGKKPPFINSTQDKLSEADVILPSAPEAAVQYSPDSRGQTSAYPGRDVVNLHGERWTKGRAHDRRPNMTHSGSTLDKRFLDNRKEDSVESIGGEHSPRLSSPITVGNAEEPDVEHGDGLRDELVLADGTSGVDREEMALDRTTRSDTCTDENPLPSGSKGELTSRVGQSSLQEIDDGGDLKATRSSANSKARSGSSRDYQQLCDSVDEEVVQHGCSTRMGNLKRPHAEDEQYRGRKVRDERHEMEKYHMAEKGREDSYSHRDWETNSVYHSHVKAAIIDRRKERENSEGTWQWRDEYSHGKRVRTEGTGRRDRGDEIGSRLQNKVRESEKMGKDEYLKLRKQLDNGKLRDHREKDVGSRHRERDDNLKSRFEKTNDLHGKRRKEEDRAMRDAEREELLHGHREIPSRRKRERDDVDLPKRDSQVRTRDDDHHSVRHKEEGWILRERERQRERDEWHRFKQSHEESLSKREREGRGVRSGRAAEDKAWVSHARGNDDHKGSDRNYSFKDTGRHDEQLKRRDRVEDGSLSQHRGREDVRLCRSQLSNDDKRSRQERTNTRNDHAVGGSNNTKVHEKKHKENTRKSKDSECVDQNSMGSSKRNHEDQSDRMNEPVLVRGVTELGNSDRDILVNRHSSRKHGEDASSDDELQDSRRGRSKLERWTSHKQRDFSIKSKLPSSLKVKEIDKYNDNGRSLSASKLPDESSKTVETEDNHRPLGEQIGVGDPETKNVEVRSMDDRHMDTVERLKKRSERFKLPMPSEKEAVVIKKMESEPLPSAQSESRVEAEIKLERPARKRRWRLRRNSTQGNIWLSKEEEPFVLQKENSSQDTGR